VWHLRASASEHAHVWAVVYDVDYPEILMQLDELVENLHRHELTPAERSSHQLSYAGLLKKANKVQKARQKQGETKSRQTKGGLEPQAAVLMSANGTLTGAQPTITEKLAADSGVDKDTIHRRHATGQKLAARLGARFSAISANLQAQSGIASGKDHGPI
jgi:hypothetical protein